jgi:molecular chaperone HtpG
MKKLLTLKVIDHLKTMALNQPDEYLIFWKTYGRYIEEGVALDPDYSENLYPLLRFESLNKPGQMISLDQYLEDKKVTQNDIFYILGDDPRAIQHSPHLEPFRKHGYDVLLLSGLVSPFMLLRLNKYKDATLVNVSSEAIKLPEIEDNSSATESDTEAHESNDAVIRLFKDQLGDKVSEVRVTNRLVESPARLVDKEGSTSAEMQKVYKYLNRDFEIPQKILEINTGHMIIQAIKNHPEDQALVNDAIDQVYENALLLEGLHPDPSGMVNRIQAFILKSLE